MSSLYERLRARANRPPVYIFNESDGDDEKQRNEADAFQRMDSGEEYDSSLDQQTPPDTRSHKRTTPKIRLASPKGKCVVLLKKSHPSEDTIANKNSGSVAEDCRFEETGSAGSNVDALNQSRPKEDESEPGSGQGNNKKHNSPCGKRARENASVGDKGTKRHGIEPVTTLDTDAGDSCLQSKLNEFLVSFHGNTVATHSIEEFLELSGGTKILNGITIPEESFDSMSNAIEKRGDFVANCWASKPVRDIMFSRLSLVFYTLTKTPLSKLSEDLLLALRDVVREAVAVGFEVDFLLHHLRKLVSALFGRRVYLEKLTAIDSQIENAQKEMDRLKAKVEELRNSRSEIVSSASVSSGTEGDCVHQALDFCSNLVDGL